jgi:WD40 repeat protein/mono/diheme cytochrome c family protein
VTRPAPPSASALPALAALVVSAIVALACAPSAPLLAAEPNPPVVSFKRDVAPVLLTQCQQCHGPEKSKGGYRLDSFDRLLKPGSGGDPAVSAGKPAASTLYTLLVAADPDERMPKKADPLPKEQVATIKAWIAQGAKFDGPDPAAALSSYVQSANDSAPAVYKRPLPVTALAFTPDGSTLLASGYHELTRWDPKTGKLVGRTPLAVQRVQAIAVDAATGRVAVVGGAPGVSGELLLLDGTTKPVDSGKPSDSGKPRDGATPTARSLEKTADLMLSVRFSPDGKVLAAGGSDGAVRVFDVATGKRLWRLEPHADWVTDLAFSPDGKLLVTASRDKSCRVFEVKSAEAEASYQDHPEPVYAVAFAGDGKAVFSAGRDRKIHMWSAADGKPLSQTGGFGGDVLRLERAGTNLFSSCGDGKLRVHATDQVVAAKPATKSTTQTAEAKKPDDKKKAAKASPQLLLRQADVSTDWLYAVAASESAGLVAAGAQDGTVGVWTVEGGKPVTSFVAAPGRK